MTRCQHTQILLSLLKVNIIEIVYVISKWILWNDWACKLGPISSNAIYFYDFVTNKATNDSDKVSLDNLRTVHYLYSAKITKTWQVDYN